MMLPRLSSFVRSARATRLVRPFLVFVLAGLVLGTIAGASLWRPSVDNHYAHMAQGWLEGRLHLAGPPPHANDWGKLTTLELADGRVVRAMPCRTATCRTTQRRDQVEPWITTRGETLYVALGEVRRRTHVWHVTFPPGPALLFLPGVATWGLGFWDVLLTVLAAAAIPAVLLHLLDRERGTCEGRGRQHVWAAAAWTVASPACFVGAHGSVWFTAQILTALFVVAYIAAAWNLRRPVAAGIWLALALACRPHVAVLGVFYLMEWWRRRAAWQPLLTFLLPLACSAIALGWLNWVRFDNPFEFGHRYLDVRWQARMQEHGLFSLAYLERNLQAMLLLVPQIHPAAPYVRWSIHGMGLPLASPWLLAAWRARNRFPQRVALWTAAGLAAIPALLYHNTGQVQFSYRFALDWLPLALVAIVCGDGVRRGFMMLVVAAAAVQIYGAWMFGRAPARLFVADFWPFTP